MTAQLLLRNASLTRVAALRSPLRRFESALLDKARRTPRTPAPAAH